MIKLTLKKTGIIWLFLRHYHLVSHRWYYHVWITLSWAGFTCCATLMML